MNRIFAALMALVSIALTTSVRAQTPTADLAQPPANAETWVIVSSAGQHGQSRRWTAPDGVRWSRESLLLRGFVTEIDQQIAFAPDHTMTLPASVIDMFMGSLGEPDGGWPKKLQKIILRDAKPQSENKFKIELAKRCLTHALQTAANG